jgi:hypothetical protein
MSVLPMNSEVRTPLPEGPVTPAIEIEPAASHSEQVLITEQEVMFGSAAATTVPAESHSRWIAALRWICGRSDWRVDPARRPRPPRSSYLENARMGREMLHL